MSWSLQPRPPPTLASLTSSSLFPGTRSSRAPLLVGSFIACARSHQCIEKSPRLLEPCCIVLPANISANFEQRAILKIPQEVTIRRCVCARVPGGIAWCSTWPVWKQLICFHSKNLLPEEDGQEMPAFLRRYQGLLCPSPSLSATSVCTNSSSADWLWCHQQHRSPEGTELPVSRPGLGGGSWDAEAGGVHRRLPRVTAPLQLMVRLCTSPQGGRGCCCCRGPGRQHWLRSPPRTCSSKKS